MNITSHKVSRPYAQLQETKSEDWQGVKGEYYAPCGIVTVVSETYLPDGQAFTRLSMCYRGREYRLWLDHLLIRRALILACNRFYKQVCAEGGTEK